MLKQKLMKFHFGFYLVFRVTTLILSVASVILNAGARFFCMGLRRAVYSSRACGWLIKAARSHMCDYESRYLIVHLSPNIRHFRILRIDYDCVEKTPLSLTIKHWDSIWATKYMC